MDTLCAICNDDTASDMVYAISDDTGERVCTICADGDSAARYFYADGAEVIYRTLDFSGLVR